jgi:hypothetical protein
MDVSLRIAAALAVVLAALPARAEHDHGGHAGHAQPEARMFDVGAGIVLARYETELYAGDYQGVKPTAAWRKGRFGASAELGFYRVTENGARYFGFGDLLLGAGATVWSSRDARLAVGIPVSLPLGDHTHGLGMGHVMVMPTLVAGYRMLGASVTYGRAIGGEAHHAGHGTWPLIDPMNQQELAWSITGAIPLARALTIGSRLGGAVAIGDGTDRTHAAFYAVWTEGRVATKLDLFTGFASDPVVVGGGLSSEVSF